MKPCGCVCGMCVCCECCKKKRKRVSEPIIIEDEEIMPETTTTRPTSDLEPPSPPKKKKKKKKLGTQGNRIVISDDEDDDISATIHPTGDFEPPAPFLEPEPEPEPVQVTPNLEPPAAVPERKRKKAKHVTFNLEPPATVVTADLEPPPPPPPPRARKRITATLVTHDLEPPAPVTEGGGDDENPFLAAAAAAAAATKNGYKRRIVDVTDEKTGKTYQVYDPFWDKMLESSDGKELDRQLHYMQLGGEFVDKKLGERAMDNQEISDIYDDWLEKAFDENWSDEKALKKLKKMLEPFFS